jgi:AcrR family transcriptional regulator
MSKEERKAWEKEQRRDRIVDRAQEVFFKRGFDGATIEDIAAAAGYSKRSIYLYFRDREELFLAVALRGQTLLYEMLSRALEGEGGGEHRLLRMGRAFYEFSLSHPEFFGMIMAYESRIHAYRGDDDLDDTDSPRARCRELSIKYGGLVIHSIEEEIKSGRLSTSLEPLQLMLILWGQVFGVMQIILMRKEGFMETYGITPDALFGEFLSMMVKALTKGDAISSL